jgi:hypothetical protein
MRKLNGVGWTCCRSDRSTETQDEAASDELTHAMSRCLDSGSNQNQRTTNENTDTTTVTIGEKSTD